MSELTSNTRGADISAEKTAESDRGSATVRVLLVNGSPRENGSTAEALWRMAEVFDAEGARADIFNLGAAPMPDCAACFKCRERGRCIFDDGVNVFAKMAEDADGFIFGSPVYYAHPSGRLLSFMDRLFLSASDALRHKPAAAVFTSRRAGATSSLDAVNKHFLMAEMPIVSSTYWNQAFVADGGIKKDAEGISTLGNLAKNMIWLIRAIKHARGAGIVPPKSLFVKTGFLS